MVREGLLKENIDGEAILWAKDQLLKRPEEKKILLVMSDGAPVDDSTLSVNDPRYLEDHLLEAIADVKGNEAISLIGLGLGYDLTRYYGDQGLISDFPRLGLDAVRSVIQALR
jgi:cobaltochelatase CobT